MRWTCEGPRHSRPDQTNLKTSHIFHLVTVTVNKGALILSTYVFEILALYCSLPSRDTMLVLSNFAETTYSLVSGNLWEMCFSCLERTYLLRAHMLFATVAARVWRRHETRIARVADTGGGRPSLVCHSSLFLRLSLFLFLSPSVNMMCILYLDLYIYI